MKNQITCERCGFMAFVDGQSPIQSIGWRMLDTKTGRGICPACVGEEEPAEPPAPKTKTA
jgi:hypothetical protein